MSALDTARVWGVIPAAGIGSRMGSNTPKQYLRIGGRTLLEHAAAALLDAIDEAIGIGDNRGHPMPPGEGAARRQPVEAGAGPGQLAAVAIPRQRAGAGDHLSARIVGHEDPGHQYIISGSA